MHHFPFSCCTEDVWLLFHQSESDKRERLMTVLCGEVVHDEGEDVKTIG